MRLIRLTAPLLIGTVNRPVGFAFAADDEQARRLVNAGHAVLAGPLAARVADRPAPPRRAATRHGKPSDGVTGP